MLDIEDKLNRKVGLVTDSGLMDFARKSVDKDKILIYELIIPNVNKQYSLLFKNFISRLLHKDIHMRLSIREALDHPWIKGADLIFHEKEKIYVLEKFLINLVTDTIKPFNDYIHSMGA